MGDGVDVRLEVCKQLLQSLVLLTERLKLPEPPEVIPLTCM